jgi:hypothetical protein
MYARLRHIITTWLVEQRGMLHLSCDTTNCAPSCFFYLDLEIADE